MRHVAKRIPGVPTAPMDELFLFPAVGFVSRLRGLHAFQGLAWGCGLWIAPCGAIHTFGMGYAIDVLFLDRGHRIVRKVRHMRPNRIAWCAKARSVVELPAGYCAAVPHHEKLVATALHTLTSLWGARPDINHRTG
ncbi:MAG TPA: DUF192 domain-containing protein [Burkholderiaceae bacterium]|nr:DUF192 domain-containing protein [Burkholderiaceae bacterium]